MRRKNNLSEEEQRKMLDALFGRNVPVRQETALKPEGEEETGKDGQPEAVTEAETLAAPLACPAHQRQATQGIFGRIQGSVHAHAED